MPPNFNEIIDTAKVAVHNVMTECTRVMTIDEFKLKCENKIQDLYNFIKK